MLWYCTVQTSYHLPIFSMILTQLLWHPRSRWFPLPQSRWFPLPRLRWFPLTQSRWFPLTQFGSLYPSRVGSLYSGWVSSFGHLYPSRVSSYIGGSVTSGESIPSSSDSHNSASSPSHLWTSWRCQYFLQNQSQSDLKNLSIWQVPYTNSYLKNKLFKRELIRHKRKGRLSLVETNKTKSRKLHSDIKKPN
jgi:hypothetical protein